MDLREAIDGWLSQMHSQPAEKLAQAVDDKDPAMPKGRLLIDGKATRQAIFDHVKNSVIKRFPIEDDKYRVELADVDYEGPTNYSLAQQKQAILHNKKLGCSLKGTWRLIDKSTGRIIEEKRDAIMRVPYYTNRGTIINNGSEYTVISQARLSPGVYTRRKQNGDLESQFNVSNGKGFRIALDKSTGRMNFRMGQASLPLYPILKAFGVTDKQLAEAWGSDVAFANSEKNDPKTIQKLYEKIAGYKTDPLMTPQNQAKFIQSELGKFGLDPATVVRTLGLENVKGVTPDVILRASQKLLNVNRGIEEPDNRDNPRFCKFYGVEHLLGERIDKDAAKLIKPMLFKIRRDGNLSRVGRNALGPYIDDFLSTSGLAQPGEEANPMSILIQQSRITRTGEGGISSPDLITPEARGVQGDYLGYVDFIATPESTSAGVDVRASYGTVLGSDNRLYNIFRNMQTGKKEYLALDDAADKTIAFPDQDPKAPYMYCMKNGVPTRVKTSEVDYMVPSFSRTLGAGINMNPMPTSTFGQRSFYSSKFWEQYLPQKEGEVPFVDSLMPDGKMTFNEYYGRRSGCVTAPFAGVVTSVTKDGITIKGKNGKTETFDLVENLPYNRMTQLSLMPLVKKGMEIKEGDILAHSNFTDAKTGAFNMGRNLKVAILPGPRGANSVTGDTFVFWRKPDGKYTFTPISEAAPWGGMKSIAMDQKTLDHGVADCMSWMIHRPDSPLYEVTLQDGYKVVVTGSHGLMRYDGRSGIESCRADQVLSGDLMPFVKARIPYGTGDSVVRYNGLHRSSANYELTVPLDREFGWFVGIYLAEGCVAYRKSGGNEQPRWISIACTEREIIDHIAAACKRMGASCRYVAPGVSKTGARNGGVMKIHHAALCHFLADNTGRYAWGKRIPDCLWTAPREFAEGLVDGYFCGDGTVGDRQATATTTSRALAEALCLVLSSFGIRANCRQYKFSTLQQKHPVWLVTILGEYLSLMPFISLSRKRMLLEKLASVRSCGKFSRDRVPVPKAMRGRYITAASGTKRQVPYLSYIGRNKYRSHIQEGVSRDADSLFSRTDIWWDVVKSVRRLSASERDDRIVYDLDMSPYGTFMVGYGLIVHNSFEDACIISEDAAKKLATSRMYNFDQDTKNGISINKSKFIAAFPKEFTKEQVETLDDSGVVKVGTELHRGDPIIAAVGPKLLSAEDAQLGKLSSVLKNALTNKSQTWDHDWPGVVTDVVSGPNGAKVLIKSEPPVKVGDKLCYDEDTEVLTSHGWKLFRDLSLEDNVATLNPETFEFDYIKPDMVRRYEHEGHMYHIENSCLDLTVTDNHRMFVQRRGHADFEFLEAKDILGKRVSYKKDGVWYGTEVSTFTFPAYQVGHRWGLLTKPETTVPMDTFLMLLGMYLSEGNVRNNPDHRVFGIDITHVKQTSLLEARKALDAAGVRYSYNEASHKIFISGRQYAEYFGQFGNAWNKYIPEFVFGLSARQQKILFKWLMWGDGHSVKGVPKVYTTTSRRLADDVQRLCLHIGCAGHVLLHDKAGSIHGKICGRTITAKHDCYAVQIINKNLTPTVNHGHTRRQHVQKEGYVDYSGYVYCCTMPKWHAIYVRRNGHACWCGNSPRFALKGVTGTILPMDKMPRDAVTNEPYDMIVNPMGFLSRVAPGQLMEIALGKVAKKTGQQIRIPQLPPPEGWLNWTKKQLSDAGVSDTADVFDPQTGRTIKNVGDGYMYVQAMHHLAEKKYSARGIEGGYTQDQQPAKGGPTGAKKISGFDTNALLSHGATEVLRDAMTIRGQCFDASTEVLTRRGWLHWDEVCADDEFLTKDKYGDNSARYEHPIGLIKYHYKGDMYGYENRHLDWLVTPDHSLWGINCLVSRKKPYRRYRTFKAADAFGKEGTIETFGHVYPGSIPSDSTVQFLKSPGSKRNEKELSVRLHDYCAFMGWWLSEGSARYDGARGIIVISQDEYVNSDNFKDIQALGRRMGLGSGTLIRKSGNIGFGSTSPADAHVGIKWYSKPLAMHLMQFGSRAWDKRIPELIFEAPVECRQAFLDSFIKGDGCESKTRSGNGHVYWHIGTTSIDLMNDLQRLGSITGYAAFTGLDARAGTYGHKHAYYRVILSKNTTEATIRKNPAVQFKGHYKLPYSGMVYCATMSTGLLYVRRNGKCMWSGNCNEEYWRKLRLGLPIPEPDVPFIYQKFINNLKAGGINVVEKGDITSLMPQTDASIEELAGGRIIDSAQMVDANMNPVKGGLFDLGMTGGAGGNRWSMIELPEPVPNPVMEEPVRRVLGLTAKGLSDILSGKKELNGKTGGTAIKEALSNVDTAKLIAQARSDIKTKRGSVRDNAIKVLGYLTAAADMKVKPSDWMISKVPVIPPAFRPISKVGDVALVPDTNELYKELLENKHNYELLKKDLPDSALTDERINIYKSVKAAFGLGNSITAEGQAKNLKGPIRQIIGTVPKWGQFQSKVVAKNQDLVGRSVTVPDKNLSMDQVGIPEDMAWTMYKPFVTRKLVQRGYSPVDAVKMIDDKTPTARHILDDVMKEKPVLMDRAPTWHKFNIMAFKPFITDGKEIRVCPMIDSGYNMDHDGDESRSPYITTLISDDFFKTLAIDIKDNVCYNPCITKQVIKDRAMRKDSVVINGENVNGTVVSLRWDEFPHYDNPTLNSHPNANFYLVPDGVFVRAYDENTGDLVWAPVKYWSHHGVNQKLEIVTVELSSGRQILTDDDPRGVYGIDPETMEFGRWRPSDSVGKFVPRCIKDELHVTPTDSIYMSDYSGDMTGTMPLDRTSGWFLGAMIGDGWDTVTTGKSINVCFCYDKNYNDLGEAFKMSLRHAMYGGDEVHFGVVEHNSTSESGRYGDAITLRHASMAAGRFIHNVIGHGAENKHLPPFWQNTSKEFRLGLFEGLMDTDGTVSLTKAKAKKNRQLVCNYSTVSMTLATEVQYLCRTLGIDSKLTTQKTPAGGKCWQVSISTKNLKSLGLKLHSPVKAKNLDEAEVSDDSSAGGRKYMIPVPVKELKKISSILLALDRSAYITLNRTCKKGYAPTTIANKIAKVLRGAPELQTDAWKKWLSLYDNIDNVVWERVDGFVNTGMYEDGYDLTVPGYETFMNSDGVILSNTVNMHVPASDKASKEALEKMLPSKNLLSLTDMSSVRYKPEKEQVSGLWALTAGVTNKQPRVFDSKADAIKAYRNGEIGPNDPIVLAG